MSKNLNSTHNNEAKQERVILVGACIFPVTPAEFRASMNELAFLVRSAGSEVAGEIMQNLDALHPGTYIGRGKIEEVKALCVEMEVIVVVINDELSPAQKRNLEKQLECKVLDRTELILDIFACRAKTAEAALQVELAQLQYMYPRLTNLWVHFSRLGGGIGTRGPGETQLEVDRRNIKTRISKLKKELIHVKTSRDTQRQKRSELHLPLLALVGYTNAGKSTIMNQLAHSDVLAKNILFATLDTTVKRVELKSHQAFLLVDTVGFIRKLPHHLVEAFRSTLDEVVRADLLVHVVDMSSPLWKADIEAVNKVLDYLGALDKLTLMIFNKKDRLTEESDIEPMLANYSHSIAISALAATDITSLLSTIESVILECLHQEASFMIPYTQTQWVHELKQSGHIAIEEYLPEGIHIKGHFPQSHIEKIEHLLQHINE